MIVVPVIVKKSKINGLGVFAKRLIRKGETIVVDGGEKRYTKTQMRKFSKRYLGTLRKYGYWDNGIFVYHTDAARYINHSCDPNVKNFGKVDKAVRTIKKGEEVTYDYTILAGKKQTKCNCGSKKCKGKFLE
jgi:uncharacterized protein